MLFRCSYAHLPNALRLAALGVLIAIVAIGKGSTYYVAPSGNDTAPGTSNAPVRTIQTGINLCSAGDTLVLEQGTYSGPGNIGLSVSTPITIESQSGSASIIIDCEYSDRAFTFSGVGTAQSPVLVSGVVIENGCPADVGGAVTVLSSNVVFQNCSFLGNCATNGGAMSVDSASAVQLQSCTFDSNGTYTADPDNPSQGFGGAIDNAGSISLLPCVLISNDSFTEGGAIYNVGVAQIQNSTVNENGSDSGGALYGDVASTNTLTNCNFSENSSEFSGGAIELTSGTATLFGCIFNGNDANQGGALDVCVAPGHPKPSLSVTSCVFGANLAEGGSGGALDIEQGQASIVESTLSGNNAASSGGAIAIGDGVSGDASLSLTDDILWGDSASTGAEISNNTGLGTVTYCDIQNGGFSGTGNISSNPVFVDATDGNYAVSSSSPCFGTGLPVVGGFTDASGATRHNPPTIGAYEGGQGNLWSVVSVAAGPDGTQRILWAGVNANAGKVAIWRLSSGSAPVSAVYGPFPNWTPTFLAVGPDGDERVLFTNSNGQVAVWDVASNFSYSSILFGALSWTPTSISVGPDNNAYISWVGPIGRTAITDTASNGATSAGEYGPYTDASGNPIWQALGSATGPDGIERVLWAGENERAGYVALWRVSPGSATPTSCTYGPFSGWTPTFIAVGPNGHERILFTSQTGQIALWDVSSDFSFKCQMLGSFSGWSPAALSVNPDNSAEILWVNGNGQVALFDVPTTGSYSCKCFGPY